MSVWFGEWQKAPMPRHWTSQTRDGSLEFLPMLLASGLPEIAPEAQPHRISAFRRLML
jgi:hypothetical protein